MEVVNKRNNGLDLLKIITIFLIVTYHCRASFDNSVLLMHSIDSSIEQFIFYVFSCFGNIGNEIFVVISSWLLVDRKKINFKKLIKIILDNWIISVSILTVYLLLKVNIPTEYIMSSLLPTTTKSNWFITCYLLFYFLIPYINIGLNEINKRENLLLLMVLFILYFIFNFLEIGDFFESKLITFLTIYVIIYYLKKYKMNYADNLSANIIVFCCSCILFLFMLIINYAIKPFAFHLNSQKNPLILLISISLLNIFRKIDIQNKTISKLSKLTMYIYIIHENVLFRNLTRNNWCLPFLKITGIKNIPINLIIFSLVIFIASIVISYLYDKISRRITSKITEKIENTCSDFLDIIIRKGQI